MSNEGNTNRFVELDSMRGIAALIVVIGHGLNMFYQHLDARTGVGYTLLYPLLSGHESVMFFFVLSGFVLSLPFIRGRTQPYPIFVWRRVLRIYGPYLGALVLALVGCVIWGGKPITTGWTPITWSAITAKSIVEHILFVGNYDYARYNVAFWSLVYEMRISLIFPLLFFITDRFKPHYNLAFIGLCTLVGVHPGTHKSLITFEYIGVFLIGILLAKNIEAISNLYKQLGGAQKILLVVFSTVAYLGSHRIGRIGPLWHLGDIPVAIGAAGFIIIGLNSPKARKALNATAPHFLGRISYSLYLVHGTVLFSLAAILKGKVDPLAFFTIYLPIAITLSWVFYKLVEKPFMNASKRVAKVERITSVEILPSDSVA